MPTSSSSPSINRVKVWDWPVRIFHWLGLALMVGLWWTAEQAEMDLHMMLGYSFGGLLVWRILWGVFGSQTARFSQFIRSPFTVLSYAKSLKKGQAPATLGHNPMGGYMVALMLSLMLAQFGSGLFSSDEVFTEGPLVAYASADTVSTLTWWHKTNFNLLLGCAGLHVLAVLVHSLKGERIVPAMVHGHKPAPAQQSPSFRFVSGWWALGLGLLIGAPVYYYLLRPILSYY
ncbi:cytochrome b/b6 domain-containing protein [Paraferrimonas sedimenticola]|uniref:Cytochrome b561 n=1 Tax=Paraferrimonas sedimenticola TaxID=375674 RepID=A0AA37W1X7_9GAMM|nr:cytochrome b/b6 domain-containing protein [Paraferrimonas sedimenticola]GLP97168.1 cytochrome b561 [Paraferrimonas sedimenticola]